MYSGSTILALRKPREKAGVQRQNSFSYSRLNQWFALWPLANHLSLYAVRKYWLIESISACDEGNFQIPDWGSQGSLLPNTEKPEGSGKQAVNIFWRYAVVCLDNDSYWKIWACSAVWIMQVKMLFWFKDSLGMDWAAWRKET